MGYGLELLRAESPSPLENHQQLEAIPVPTGRDFCGYSSSIPRASALRQDGAVLREVAEVPLPSGRGGEPDARRSGRKGGTRGTRGTREAGRGSRVARRAPGVAFGQAGKRGARFSHAGSEENTREAARRLGEYLGKRKNR